MPANKDLTRFVMPWQGLWLWVLACQMLPQEQFHGVPGICGLTSATFNPAVYLSEQIADCLSSPVPHWVDGLHVHVTLAATAQARCLCLVKPCIHFHCHQQTRPHHVGVSEKAAPERVRFAAVHMLACAYEFPLPNPCLP